MSGSVVLVAAGPELRRSLRHSLAGLEVSLREVMSLEGARRHLNTELVDLILVGPGLQEGTSQELVRSLREEGFSEVIWTLSGGLLHCPLLEGSSDRLLLPMAPAPLRSRLEALFGPVEQRARQQPEPVMSQAQRRARFLVSPLSARAEGPDSQAEEALSQGVDALVTRLLPEVVESCLRRSLAGPSELQDRLRELLRSLD